MDFFKANSIFRESSPEISRNVLPPLNMQPNPTIFDIILAKVKVDICVYI